MRNQSAPHHIGVCISLMCQLLPLKAPRQQSSELVYGELKPVVLGFKTQCVRILDLLCQELGAAGYTFWCNCSVLAQLGAGSECSLGIIVYVHCRWGAS